MNNKQSSISQKIRRLLLGVSLTTVLFIGVVTVIGIVTLRNNTARVSGELGDTAAADSQQALEDMTVDSLLTLAENNAALSDAKLGDLQKAVEMIAYAATDITQNPKGYLEDPINPPDAKNKGVLTAQITRAQDEDPAYIAEEAVIMGNIRKTLMEIAQTYDNIPVSYIGSERGYLLVVDKDSDQKGEIFDPRGRVWYTSAKDAGELIWTDVYVDIFGHGLTLTCAKPYYDKNGDIAGIAGLDAFLGDLTDIVLSAKIGQTGYSFMLNEKGQVIISDEIALDDEGNVVREDMLASDNTELTAFVKRAINRTEKSGIERITLDGKECFVAFAALETAPWCLITVMEVAEAVAPALESKGHIITMKDDALLDIDIVIVVIAVALLLVLGIVVVTIFTISKKFSGSLTKPITLLQDGVQQIAEGNLDYSIEIRSGDEIETLGQSVNKMSSDLKGHIANLQKVTADKERIGAELDVATKIQASMLPHIFPSSPEQSGYDIYASMMPAKEVGGDFYDFFSIGEGKLAVVIADVSGKGVPAALFMVIAKTLIKNNAQYGLPPREVFETVNDLLCENNEANMFVTAFMGILDIPTGRFTYVNAGHNPPLYKRGDGNYEWLPAKPGFVLAGMDGMGYRQDEITMTRGDTLVLYTDGVTEAVNNKNELFTESKLLAVANQNKDSMLREFVTCIKTEIDLFAQGAEQADDITMLVMKFTGGTQ